MIPVFPFGAAAAASLMIRRRNEEEEKKKKKKNEVPKSRFVITVDDDKIVVSPNVVNEFDWARAAWAMIKACEEKGQGDNLRKILDSEGK